MKGKSISTLIAQPNSETKPNHPQPLSKPPLRLFLYLYISRPLAQARLYL